MNSNDNRNSQMAHFNKINIFGSSKVGKSSLILSIEKYLDKDFKIEEKKEEEEINHQEQSGENNEDEENPVNAPKLTQQIKRINISFNESTELYLDLYETNIDNIEFLKENIDTLITYSECLLFMIDITSINSFNEISKFLPLIIESYKGKNIPPMIFLSNKNDLETSREVKF